MGWETTGETGVRYREHPTRKHFGRPDRYFAIRICVDGRRHEEGLGWASEGWTLRKAAAQLAELRRGIVTGEGPRTMAEKRSLLAKKRAAAERTSKLEAIHAVALGQFLREYYIPHARKTKRSWMTDNWRIEKEIIPALGGIPLQAVTRRDIEAFLERLGERGAAQATVNQYHAILRAAYNLAAQTTLNGLPLFEGQSPLFGIKTPDPHNRRDRFLSFGEADRLIAASARKDTDLHDFIVLSLNTGLRLGELQRMEWIDVDLEYGILTVRDGPRRKPGGKVPINDDAALVLRSRLARRAKGEPKIFPPIRGAVRNISKSFQKLVKELGFNEGIKDRRLRVVFHTLRHTFASWLALAGTDIYRIKKLMRHKTLAMTERYAHLIPDATRDAVHHLRPPKESKPTRR